MKKKKIILLAVVGLIGFLGWKGFSLMREFNNAVFPHKNVAFETSMELVDVQLGNTHLKVPKAYISWPSHLKGGELGSLQMRANIDEGMIPWTKSENYKNRIKEGMIRIVVQGEFIEKYIENFPNEDIQRFLERQKRNFGDRYDEVEYGTFKEIFTRYDQLGNFSNTNKIGRGSNFYLVQKIETKKPYKIKCPISDTPKTYANPRHNCTVTSIVETNIGYNFMIPIAKVEEFIEWDKKVEDFVKKLIVRKEN